MVFQNHPFDQTPQLIVVFDQNKELSQPFQRL
jgi:hypothetical protein